MEKTIENAIDKGLESISSQLYIFSIGFGTVLVIAGIILFVSGKISKEKNKKTNIGLICIIVGIIAAVSGVAQMF